MIGMICRADFGHGLAQQTKTFYDHLKPDRTVVVDMSELNDFPQDFAAYPDAVVSSWKGFTAPLSADALDWLRDCDIVYSAETYYDERLPKIVDTILHVNPEFFRDQPATQYWYPTTWRLDQLPKGEVVPTPIDDADIVDEPTGERLLHVGGWRAAGDRNGSAMIPDIISKTSQNWRITSQSGMRLNPRLMGRVEVMGHVENRWDLYEGCGVLVYPRRYGGQSIVVNEACARGLVPVMGDHSPNSDFPAKLVPSRPGGYVKTPGGRVRSYMMGTAFASQAIYEVLEDLPTLQKQAIEWARERSWSQIKLPL